MLEELTPEQEALIPVVVADYMKLLDPPPPIDMEVIQTWLKRVYASYSKPVPERVEVALSPQAALKLATELTGEPQTSLDWVGVSDAGWVSRYDFWHRAGVLTDEECVELLEHKAFMFSAWDTALLDECAIIVARPELIVVDSAGSLHSATGPCIQWKDGEKDFAWHGVWVPEVVIMAPGMIARDEYLAMNSEVRRAVGEHAGWKYVTELLGAEEVNAWTDPVTGLAYALFHATSGENWIRKQSPRLQDGSQPLYFEPVHEDLKTAQAARKWQAVELSPEECERDPELVYGQEA